MSEKGGLGEQSGKRGLGDCDWLGSSEAAFAFSSLKSLKSAKIFKIPKTNKNAFTYLKSLRLEIGENRALTGGGSSLVQFILSISNGASLESILSRIWCDMSTRKFLAGLSVLLHKASVFCFYSRVLRVVWVGVGSRMLKILGRCN
jgi:hypothetical protein